MVKWQNPIVKEVDSYNIRRKGRFIELIRDDGLMSYYTTEEAECWSIHTRKCGKECSVEILDRVGQAVMCWKFDDQTSTERCLKRIAKTINRPRYLALKWFIGAIILYFALVGLVDFIHLLSSDNNMAVTNMSTNESPSDNHGVARIDQLSEEIASAETMAELHALIGQATDAGLLASAQEEANNVLGPTNQVVAPGYPESCDF